MILTGFLVVLCEFVVGLSRFRGGSPSVGFMSLPKDYVRMDPNLGFAPVGNRTEIDRRRKSPFDVDHFPKILCFVPVTFPERGSIDIIRDTWGRRCDKLIFPSTGADESRDVVKIPKSKDRDLWGIIHNSLTYIHDEILSREHFDFILKADDDSFVVVENLRHLINKRGYRSDDAHYLGAITYQLGKGSEFNLGCGYALSKKALETIAPRLPSSKEFDAADWRNCGKVTWSEDEMLGECLRKSGIYPDPTRDGFDREAFLAFDPRSQLEYVRREGPNEWFWRNKPGTVKGGGDCCSARPILWHSFKEKIFVQLFGSLKATGRDKVRHMYYGLEYLMYQMETNPL